MLRDLPEGLIGRFPGSTRTAWARSCVDDCPFPSAVLLRLTVTEERVTQSPTRKTAISKISGSH